MSDIKKRFLAEMMGHVGKGAGSDMKSRYAPKPPPMMDGPDQAAPSDPSDPSAPPSDPSMPPQGDASAKMSWDQIVSEHPEILEALLAALTKPGESAPAAHDATVVIAKPASPVLALKGK